MPGRILERHQRTAWMVRTLPEDDMSLSEATNSTQGAAGSTSATKAAATRKNGGRADANNGFAGVAPNFSLMLEASRRASSHVLRTIHPGPEPTSPQEPSDPREDEPSTTEERTETLSDQTSKTEQNQPDRAERLKDHQQRQERRTPPVQTTSEPSEPASSQPAQQTAHEKPINGSPASSPRQSESSFSPQSRSTPHQPVGHSVDQSRSSSTTNTNRVNVHQPAAPAGSTSNGTAAIHTNRPIDIAPPPSNGNGTRSAVLTNQATGAGRIQPATQLQLSGSSSGQTGSASENLNNLAGKITDAGSKVNNQSVEFRSLLKQAGRSAENGTNKTQFAHAARTSNSAEGPLNLEKTDALDKLARIMRSQTGPKRSNMLIQLDPPELGRLRVDVRMENQQLTVRFQAETQVGHDALKGRLHDLRQALQQHGIQLDRAEVEFQPPTTPSNESRQAPTPDQRNPQQWGSADLASQQDSGNAGGRSHSPDGPQDTGLRHEDSLNETENRPVGTVEKPEVVASGLDIRV